MIWTAFVVIWWITVDKYDRRKRSKNCFCVPFVYHGSKRVWYTNVSGHPFVYHEDKIGSKKHGFWTRNHEILERVKPLPERVCGILVHKWYTRNPCWKCCKAACIAAPWDSGVQMVHKILSHRYSHILSVYGFFCCLEKGGRRNHYDDQKRG